ncbi:MAG: hypothetical protein IJ306_04320 [Oscillospiraceae bacterium]|nr:hypothetical protein [Oscillospiraceae bacterium]
MDKPGFAGNTDTGFLKTVAFITMLADHVGYLFFPAEILWRIVGRIAFPLFAYCLALGFFYTKSVRKYFIRLLCFSFVSQVPYTLCFYPYEFGGSIADFHLNIGFTMMLGLWAIWGIDRKKYLHAVIAVLLSFVPAVEYGFYGVAVMIIAYLFMKKEKSFFGIAMGLALASPFFEFFTAGYLDPQGFAVLALPLMLTKTKTGIKIPKWLNYGFYPIHLCLLTITNYFI